MAAKKNWLFVLFLFVFILSQNLLIAGTFDVEAAASQEDKPFPDQPQAPQAYSLYLPYMIRPPGSLYKSTYGVETWTYSKYDNSSILLNQAQFYWIRRNGLIWSDVEPSKGSRIWTANSVVDLEGDFTYAAENGRKIILIVRSTPSWAQVNGKACGRI